MKRLTPALLILLLTAAVLPPAMGFSLLGPFKVVANGYVDDWQIPRHGYNINGAIGGTMEPMEGYRWNMPIVTYAYDRSFFAYFGSNGVNAVESAIAILNNLPEASAITNDTARLYINGLPVPYSTKRVNYRAEALGIVDVKSTALRILLEEMGLAEAERWCFAIRNRRVLPGGIIEFAVRKQNFDPITLMPTNRVNDATYSYFVLDVTPAISDAWEFAVDGFAANYSSVSGFALGDVLIPPSPFGVYFDGLSHDDVGGLRWLLNPNNLAVEVLPPGTIQTSRQVTGPGGGSTGGGDGPWTPAIVSTNLVIGTGPWTPVFAPTNAAGLTNLPGVTNVVTTNDLSTLPRIRPGVNKVFFQRVIFDDLLGSTFTPVTVRWTDRLFSGGRINSQGVQRVVTQPDIVFSAGDTGVGVIFPTVFSRTVTAGWTNLATLNGSDAGSLGGPGVIYPPVRILFSDQWPVFDNFEPGGQLEWPPNSLGLNQIWLYGSFDGSTNAPIVYPQYGNLTIADIEAYINQFRQRP